MFRKVVAVVASLMLWCLLLSGCAHSPAAGEGAWPADVPELGDRFAPPAVAPLAREQIFALSPEMKAFVERARLSLFHQSDPRRALMDMLYAHEVLALEYDSTFTRTAAQAFDARRGNCLSLVIMSSALAEAMGMPVQYQQVLIGEAWSRVGDLYVSSGHVNLVLGMSARARWIKGYDSTLIVDFLPGAEMLGARARRLGESTIVAMFQNNRAAESLSGGDLDTAFAWARAAVRSDRTFVPAITTLGVVYQRAGHVAEAQHAFEAALVRDPDNVPALRNLVSVLESQEPPSAQTSALRQRLARLEPNPPFFWFNAGVQAMRVGRYAEARDLFEREIRRDANYHEFHFWLAQAELALGHAGQAQRQLELARQASTTSRQEAMYSAKLERLRTLMAPH